MITTSNSTPTPSDYQADFGFPTSSLKIDLDGLTLNETDYDICELTPKLSNTSYAAISVDDVDRLRQIIGNMKCKRNDGIQIEATDTDTNANATATWLVCHTPNLSYNKYACDNIFKYSSYEELKQKTEHSTNDNKLYEPRWTPKATIINNTNNKSTAAAMPWSYYKDNTIKRLRNPLIEKKPDGTYFILAQSVDNLINNELKISFLQNMDKLQCDMLIEYDLRDITYNKHLHHKTNEFGADILYKYMVYPVNNDMYIGGGITPPRYYAPCDPYDSDSDDNGITPRIPEINDLRSNESNISLINIPSPMNRSLYNLRSKSIYSDMSDSPSNTNYNANADTQFFPNTGKKYKPFFNDNIGCIQYKCIDNDGHEINEINKNTAFIHDIIDPNKNINDNHLWIPSIFDCVSQQDANDGFDGLIQSQIVGLDYVKYADLYKDIGSIFKKMQCMFENVVNRKLTSSEKIIIRLKKCVLQKYGDEYEESMHKEGMGENIECIGLYFAQIYNRKSIRLQLSLHDSDSNKNNINVYNGDCVVFSNECYHGVQRIVHNNKSDTKAIYLTVLSFYLINKDEINILCCDNKLLNANLIYNWSYIISYWLKYYYFSKTMSNSWMNGLIYLYLFGIDYDEYIYDRRQNIISEKEKAIIKPNQSFNITHHLQSLLHDLDLDLNINQ